jgi:hypothetical protein
MAIAVKGDELTLTGTAPITLIAAPGASVQRAVPASAVSVYNADSVNHDITFQKKKGGTTRVLFKAAGVVPGGSAILPKKVVLDATDESLEAKDEATATTLEPVADVMFLEIT